MEHNCANSEPFGPRDGLEVDGGATAVACNKSDLIHRLDKSVPFDGRRALGAAREHAMEDFEETFFDGYLRWRRGFGCRMWFDRSCVFAGGFFGGYLNSGLLPPQSRLSGTM
jgi:hypothetical protein